MHLLLIEDWSEVQPRLWSDLRRMGCLPRYDGENVFLDCDWAVEAGVPNRRASINLVKEVLEGQSVTHRGVYRDIGNIPYPLKYIPLRRPTGLEWSKGRNGHIEGGLSPAKATGTCSWCSASPLHIIHDASPNGHIVATSFVCPFCLITGTVERPVPEEAWPDMIEFLKNVPRPPMATEAKRQNQVFGGIFTPGFERVVGSMSAEKKRSLGIGGIPQPKGLVPEEDHAQD